MVTESKEVNMGRGGGSMWALSRKEFTSPCEGEIAYTVLTFSLAGGTPCPPTDRYT